MVREIEGIAEEHIFIVDDNFLFNHQRVDRFCRLLAEKGIRKKYILFGRADFIVRNEELIRRLRDVGLHAVFVGVESIRQKDLEALNKRSEVAMNEKAIRVLERHGIECYCGIVVGPDWGEEDFDDLTHWLNGLAHPLVNIQPVTPLPGTPLYDRMRGVLRVPREQYARYDMAHLLWQPERLSVRRYYWLILRTYYRTMAGAARPDVRRCGGTASSATCASRGASFTSPGSMSSCGRRADCEPEDSCSSSPPATTTTGWSSRSVRCTSWAWPSPCWRR